MRELTTRRLALWLSLTPRLGPIGIGAVLDVIKVRSLTPEQFLLLPPDQKRKVAPKLTPEAIRKLSRPIAEQAAEYDPMEERLAQLGVEWVTIQDATYPAKLMERHRSPPAVVYLYGNRGLLGRSTFAAFSSRRSPQRALERMERVVEKFVLEPRILVGGHSTPAYQRASVVPLRWGTPRILVLDCGIFRALSEDLTSEPFRTARLWRYNFDAKTDLVITDCHPYALAMGRNQPRDWLIAALADVLVFAAVREGGVMEEIGLQALGASRDVMALEWQEDAPGLAGNARLIAEGATAILD